jgi:muramoyltetrapeptide carboxypeptidase
VRVIAPSSPFDRARFERGLPLLEARYRVELAPGLFEKAGFLAGPDETRLADLTSALDDPSVAALIAARGGYGATRLLPELSLDDVQRADKWLVGFSDVTALHALWARAGLCSVHGAMVASLWEGSEQARDSFFALLEGGTPPPLSGLSTLRGGRAQGRLFGGNLTVLAALLGTPYMPSLEGCVLALEDVGERPYRIDRMLTSLAQAGALSGVSAVILGQFTDCTAGVDGITADQVLHAQLAALQVPVLWGASFGHVADNHPLLFGAQAEVDGDRATVHFTAPA